MNLKLFPNVVKVDFVVGTKELFRLQDEIKQISFNKYGSLVGLSTKQSKFYIFDFFGRSVLGVIPYFFEKKYKIKNFCFDENNNLYIAYEYTIIKENNNSVLYSGIKQINIELSLQNSISSNFGGKEENVISISEDEKNEHEIFNKTTNAKIFEILYVKEDFLICGNNPAIYNFKDKKIFYFLKQELISLTPFEDDENNNSNKKKNKDKNKNKKKLDKEYNISDNNLINAHKNNEYESGQNIIDKDMNNNDNQMLFDEDINSLNNISNDIITTEIPENK